MFYIKQTAKSERNWPAVLVNPDPMTKVYGLKFDETNLQKNQTTWLSFSVSFNCSPTFTVATKASTQVSIIDICN